eukprot:scaffold318413_cov32-Tisochrysis_lutea.AAC.3
MKKEEKKVVEEKEPTEMLERIEWLKKRTTTRTPVTLERLNVWLERKKAKQEAEQLAKLGSAKAALSSGKKLAGLTGRDLFSVDATLFIDDADAGEDKFTERTNAGNLSDDEEDEEAQEGVAFSSGTPGNSDLVIGERIEGKYMGGKQWYKGIVVAVNPDGTAQLEYEDGDVEENVPRENIRPLDRAPPASALAAAKPFDGDAAADDSGTLDLSKVDESLFDDADFPDDDELEELESAAAPASSSSNAKGVDLGAVDTNLFLDEDFPSDED